MTTVIYDNNGRIILMESGGDTRAENGVNIIECDIPEGYEVASIDPETGEPVLVEKPKTEAERIAELEAQMNAILGTEE